MNNSFRNVVQAVGNVRRLQSAAVLSLVVWGTMPSYALNPSNPPGENFDLSGFSLQLPTGSTDHPDTISYPALKTYQDSGHQYFFTESGDGAMVMKVYGAPPTCVTTKNSEHCRTELRETDSWNPTASVNKLKATVAVTRIDNGSVVVGQIHQDDSISVKPVMELYYESNGDLKAGVEKNRDGTDGQGTPTLVGHVAVGTQFSYEIDYQGGALSVTINGKKTSLSQKNLNNPKSYFKAGCYDQGTGVADVHFLALSISH